MGPCASKGTAYKTGDTTPIVTATLGETFGATFHVSEDEDVFPHCSSVLGGAGKFLVSGVSGNCYLYDLETSSSSTSAALHPTFEWNCGKRPVNKVYAFHDKGYITASGDGTVKLWDLQGSAISTLASHEMSVNGIDFTKERLISGSRDYVVKMIDLETSAIVAENKIHRNVVTGVKCCPSQGGNLSSDVFLQTSEDLQLRIYDKDLKAVSAIQMGPNQVIACELLNRGNEVVCGTKGFSPETVELIIVDLRTMTIRKKIDKAAEQNIESIARWNDKLVCASKDGSLTVWSSELVKINSIPLDFTVPGNSCCVSDNLCLLASMGPRLTAVRLDTNKIIRHTEC